MEEKTHLATEKSNHVHVEHSLAIENQRTFGEFSQYGCCKEVTNGKAVGRVSQHHLVC